MDWHRFFLRAFDGPSFGRWERWEGGDGSARVGVVADMVMRDPPARPLAGPVNALWRRREDRWERWSTAWKDYEPDDVVPDSLLAAVAAMGPLPDGTRFRRSGDEWRRLADDEADELPPS